MNIILFKKNHIGQRGYTLLFAVLTATIVLGVAVFILAISKGQYLLASTARESIYSAYAARSGIECAKLVTNGFATTTGVANNMKCANGAYDFYFSPVNILGYKDPYIASSTITLGDGGCVEILFIKSMQDDLENVQTRIEATGYNLCKSSLGLWLPDTSNPRLVSRGLYLNIIGS